MDIDEIFKNFYLGVNKPGTSASWMVGGAPVRVFAELSLYEKSCRNQLVDRRDNFICIHFENMDIKYDNSKDVQCYKNFVENPENRKAIKDFTKLYGKQMLEPAKKLHDRLKNYKSAGAYNRVYISTDNRIEVKRGGREREPLILKVRVSQSYRKFFHAVNDADAALLTEEWHGDFDSIIKILIKEINKHNYGS